MTATNTNARPPRKSLATQLDRLDTILDGLADGLNEAVATAVKEAVVIAVEAVLREMLTNHELQRRLRSEPVVAEPTVVQPSLVRRAASAVGRSLRSCWCWLTAKARSFGARTAVVASVGVPALMVRVRHGMTAFARRIWSTVVVAAMMTCRYRRALVIALVVGTLIGVGCYLAGPGVASCVSGVAGFFGSLIASALNHLRRMLGGDGVEDECFGRLT
jgi:hypothetical protein